MKKETDWKRHINWKFHTIFKLTFDQISITERKEKDEQLYDAWRIKESQRNFLDIPQLSPSESETGNLNNLFYLPRIKEKIPEHRYKIRQDLCGLEKNKQLTE